MRHATEAWAGVVELEPKTETIVVAEGDSGIAEARKKLTAERLDQIALFFAAPSSVREHAVEWAGPRDLHALASTLGCSTVTIDRWRKNPRMIERVAEMLHAVAVYSMSDILWGQIVAATPQIVDGKVIPADTKAANFVATIAKFMRQGGGSTINMNQNNVMPTTAEEPSDERLDDRIDELLDRRQRAQGGDEV